MKRLVLTLLAAAGTAFAAQAPKANAPAPKESAAPAAKIEGIEISRGKLGYLGVSLADGGFRVAFYDKDKKPVAPDMVSAALRWPVKYKNTDERVLLQRGSDGKSLTSPLLVRPPHTFRLFISLFAEGKAEAVENYQIDFHE